MINRKLLIKCIQVLYLIIDENDIMNAKNYIIRSLSSGETYAIMNDNYTRNIRQNTAMTFLSILLFFGLTLFLLSNSQTTGAHWCVGFALIFTFVSSIYGFVSIINTRIQVSLENSENPTPDYAGINIMMDQENKNIFKNVTYQCILIISATISITLSFLF